MESDRFRQFAAWFNGELKVRGMSAAEFSRLSGVSRGRVSEYTNGQGVPSKRNAQRIADVFGISAATVLVKAQDIDSDDPLDPEGERQQLIDMVRRANLDDPGSARMLKRLLEGLLEESDEG